MYNTIARLSIYYMCMPWLSSFWSYTLKGLIIQMLQLKTGSFGLLKTNCPITPVNILTVLKKLQKSSIMYLYQNKIHFCRVRPLYLHMDMYLVLSCYLNTGSVSIFNHIKYIVISGPRGDLVLQRLRAQRSDENTARARLRFFFSIFF